MASLAAAYLSHRPPVTEAHRKKRSTTQFPSHQNSLKHFYNQKNIKIKKKAPRHKRFKCIFRVFNIMVLYS